MLQPATQAIGMGIFDTVYYAAMMHGPIVAGAGAKSAGSAASGIRLRRHRAAGVPFAALGLQSHSGAHSPHNVNAHTSCNRR